MPLTPPSHPTPLSPHPLPPSPGALHPTGAQEAEAPTPLRPPWGLRGGVAALRLRLLPPGGFWGAHHVGEEHAPQLPGPVWLHRPPRRRVDRNPAQEEGRREQPRHRSQGLSIAPLCRRWGGAHPTLCHRMDLGGMGPPYYAQGGRADPGAEVWRRSDCCSVTKKEPFPIPGWDEWTLCPPPPPPPHTPPSLHPPTQPWGRGCSVLSLHTVAVPTPNHTRMYHSRATVLGGAGRGGPRGGGRGSAPCTASPLTHVSSFLYI